jgi:BolA protein
MPATKAQIEKNLKEFFTETNTVIELKALVMDNDHWEIVIKSQKFNGLSRVEQHRMVNKALGNLAHEVHAISIKTHTL